jgi:hypothetical protein
MATSLTFEEKLNTKYKWAGGLARFERILQDTLGEPASTRLVTLSLQFKISPTQAHRWIREYEAYTGKVAA